MFESISISDSTRMTRITRIRTDTNIRVIRVPGRFCWILYGFGLLKLFFLLKHRRASILLISGALPLAGFPGAARCSGHDPRADMKQGGAPPLDFMKAASEM
jgi:hypothetical protein